MNAMTAPMISLLRPVSAAGLAADRLLVFKQCAPGGDVDDLHLFGLADDHQHCRSACSACRRIT
jgi:hypothetical protein